MRLYAGLMIALVLIAGCAAPPPEKPVFIPEPKPQSYVVLLDDGDGQVGTITVTGAKGTVVVDRLAQGALLDGSAPFAVEEARIRRDFADTIAARPEPPQRFLLYFETGGAQLTPASLALLPKLLAAARSRKALAVSVIGHTDTEGDAEGNEKLGLQRAQIVLKQLQEAGLTADSLLVESHGKRNLLVPTPDNTPEARNRRVEILLM